MPRLGGFSLKELFVGKFFDAWIKDPEDPPYR